MTDCFEIYIDEYRDGSFTGYRRIAEFDCFFSIYDCEELAENALEFAEEVFVISRYRSLHPASDIIIHVYTRSYCGEKTKEWTIERYSGNISSYKLRD